TARGKRLPDRVVALVQTRYPHLRPTTNGYRSNGYSPNGHRELPRGRVRYRLTGRGWLLLAGAAVTVAAIGTVVWSIVTATRAAIEWSLDNSDLVVGALFCLALAAFTIWRTAR